MNSQQTVAGIDLAGSERSPTGICLIRRDIAELKVVFPDSEIIEATVGASVVAIDAPLTTATDRQAERDLRRYGALPLAWRSMRMLATRGLTIAGELIGMGTQVIEVFPSATAKILGIERIPERMGEIAAELGYTIDGPNTADTLDALLAAHTARLYLSGDTEMLGDADPVVIPRRQRMNRQTDGIS